MSYTNLLYHIVYATKERAPLITRTLGPRLHEYLGGTVRGLGGIALEINGTNDHVHVLAKLRPTISVSEFMSKLKSVHQVGRNAKPPADLVGRLDSGHSPSANRKSSACEGTFVIRTSIIESNHSRKNSRRCCVVTKLILIQLICGAELLSPASQARLIVLDRFPRLGGLARG